MGAVRRKCAGHSIRSVREGVRASARICLESSRGLGGPRRLRNHVSEHHRARPCWRWAARSQSLSEHYLCQRHELVSTACNYEPRSFGHHRRAAGERQCIVILLGPAPSISYLRSALELYFGAANWQQHNRTSRIRWQPWHTPTDQLCLQYLPADTAEYCP